MIRDVYLRPNPYKRGTLEKSTLLRENEVTLCDGRRGRRISVFDSNQGILFGPKGL